MKVHLDCFPCFLRQSLIALRLGTDDEALQEAVLKSTLEYIRDTDTSQPPAYTTTFIHRKTRQMHGKDPFLEIKARYNSIALNLYPSMKALMDKLGVRYYFKNDLLKEMGVEPENFEQTWKCG